MSYILVSTVHPASSPQTNSDTRQCMNVCVCIGLVNHFHAANGVGVHNTDLPYEVIRREVMLYSRFRGQNVLYLELELGEFFVNN